MPTRRCHDSLSRPTVRDARPPRPRCRRRSAASGPRGTRTANARRVDSQRLGTSGRQRAGTPRQRRAPRTAAGRVISGGGTPEAHPPASDHAGVRPRVLPAHDRAVPAPSARRVRALRHSLRQQTSVEHRVLGSRHHEAAQVRYLSNGPPTHAVSERPSARAREPARQSADPGWSPSWNEATHDR
jgi:hypothetical protein